MLCIFPLRLRNYMSCLYFSIPPNSMSLKEIYFLSNSITLTNKCSKQNTGSYLTRTTLSHNNNFTQGARQGSWSQPRHHRAFLHVEKHVHQNRKTQPALKKRKGATQPRNNTRRTSSCTYNQENSKMTE